MVYPFMLTTTVYVNFLSSWLMPYLPFVCQFFFKTLDNKFDTCEFAQLCRLNTSRKLVDFYDKRFISRSNQISRMTRLKNVICSCDVAAKNPQVTTSKYTSLRPVSTKSRYSMFLYDKLILKHKLFVKYIIKCKESFS